MLNRKDKNKVRKILSRGEKGEKEQKIQRKKKKENKYSGLFCSLNYLRIYCDYVSIKNASLLYNKYLHFLLPSVIIDICAKLLFNFINIFIKLRLKKFIFQCYYLFFFCNKRKWAKRKNRGEKRIRGGTFYCYRGLFSP